jgi:hypothetical protein
MAFISPFQQARNGPVVIACMPKSGSTFLWKALAAVTGYAESGLNANSVIQELDPALFRRRGRSRSINQIHLIASPHAIGLLNRYAARVIVVTRKLPDILVSLRDFLHSPEIEDERNRAGVVQGTFFQIDERFYQLTEREQYDFLIDFTLPWYLWFAASWQHYRKALEQPSVWLTYERLIASPAVVIAQTLAEIGIPVVNDISASLGRLVDTRFNVGVAGRGYHLLSPEQIAAIRARAARYHLAEWDALL